MKNIRFVVLAAGKGTRMKQTTPKALTLVGGKTILQYLIESIEVSKVDGVPLIVTGPEGNRLCDAFNTNCEYVSQKEQLGTAHAVMMTREALKEAKTVIVLYGDHPFISPESLRRLAERHQERNNTITMMTTVVPNFDGWYSAFKFWGKILRGANGHISGIREYKDASEIEREIREVNPALFCFNAKWLWKNIDLVKNDNIQKEYYLTDLVQMAVAQSEKISSLMIEPEEAVGINTPQEREVAEEVATRHLK